MVDFYIAMDFSEIRCYLYIQLQYIRMPSLTAAQPRSARSGGHTQGMFPSNASGNSEVGEKVLRIGDRCYRPANSLLKALPMTILLISLVPAPISYSFASLNNLPAETSFMYPIPPMS